MAKLNDKTAKALPGPVAGRFDTTHWDDELPGFGLRILNSGRRGWVVRYRIGGKQRVISLGSTAALKAPDARKEAGRILAEGKLGNDERQVIEQRRIDASAPATLTVGKLVEHYLAHAERQQRPGTFKETSRHLRVHCAGLHGHSAETLNRRQVAELLSSLVTKSGPVASNRVRSNLSRCFSWGMQQGLVESNPVAGTSKLGQETPRERVLSPEELRLIWGATDDASGHSHIVRLLMLTGARREEVAGMSWAELDIERAEWTLPAARSKNKRPHVLPLSDAALAVLSRVPHRDGRTLLFGEGEGPFSGWSRAKATLDGRIARLRAEARLGRRLAKGEMPEPTDALPSWRVHDLRRTAVTGMVEIGVQPHVVEAVVNHISGHKGGVAGVYNRATYASEKRQALDRWAAHVEALAGGGTSKVVPLRPAAAG